MTAYCDLVEQVLDVYTKIPYAQGDLTCEAIFDRQRGRFVLMTLGWDDDERVHHPLAHIDIIDGKLWIQTDNKEHGIALACFAHRILAATRGRFPDFAGRRTGRPGRRNLLRPPTRPLF